MKKNIYKIIAIIAGVAAVACAAVGGYKYYQEKHAGDNYEEVRETVKKETEPAPVEEKAPVEIPIDFAALQEQNPEDRRAHILRLTEKGEAAFALSHELFAQWDQEVLEGFTTEEKEQLLTLLKKTLRMNRKEGVPCVRNDIQSR